MREQSEISERKKEKTAKTRQKLCKWISLIHFHQIPDVLSADSRYPRFMSTYFFFDMLIIQIQHVEASKNEIGIGPPL